MSDYIPTTRRALDLAQEVFSQINQEVGIVEVDDGYMISVDNPHAIEIVLDTLDGLTEALGQPLVFQVSRELSTNKTLIHWKNTRKPTTKTYEGTI